MPNQIGHPMLAQMTHDEAARDSFVLSLKQHISTDVGPGNRALYRQTVLPKIKAALKREPKTRHEVRKFMEREPYHQAWGSLMRTAQELMWDSVMESVDRQLPELIGKYKRKRNKLGSLRLNTDLELPRYLAAVDHHGMPGSYHVDTTQDDVRAGAIYDRGAFIYQHGKAGGALMDARGQSIAAYLREQHPDLAPKRILDMGCTVGNSTLVYCDAYPEAEIHGVEPGAPVLRYAHARAEHLGKTVHYSQQNAEHTDFEDEHFDIVLSAVMLHETSGTALRNIFKECHRLLKPGGLMAHLEVPVRYKDLSLCDQVLRDWQTYYNDEPFWGQACSADLVGLALESGFSSADEGYQPQPKERGVRTSGFTKTPNQNPGWWYIMSALK